MPVQYLYPINDNIFNYGHGNWYKSTNSISGFYSYVDEGVSTYNDLDYINSSGRTAGVPTQDPYWTSIAFNLDRLQVIPSSITVNLRASWVPTNNFDIKASGLKIYLYGSGIHDGSLYNVSYTTSELFRSEICGGSYHFLNEHNILASSVSYVVPSGDTFANYSINLTLSDEMLKNVKKYTGATYLYVGFGNWRNKLSAIEVVASGEYVQATDLNLHLPGGDRYNLRRERLGIYHDYGNNDVFSFPFVETGEEAEGITGLTGTKVSDSDSRWGSPQLCLWSGGFTRPDIFRDCFIEFDRPSGYYTVEDVYLNGVGWIFGANINHIDFPSSNSSHKLTVTAPSPYETPSGFVYIGQCARNINAAGSAAEDSFTYWTTSLSGNLPSALPSGDFSMWIGASTLSAINNNTSFISDGHNSFKFGVYNNLLTARLTASDGSVKSATGISNSLPTYGAIVTYNSAGLQLYSMSAKGIISLIGGTGPFTRMSYGESVSTLLFHPTNANSIALKLYELGIVGSGISSYDLARMDRYQLFQKLNDNLYESQPITSGMINIKYNSLEDRRLPLLSAYSGYTQQPYFVGNGVRNFADRLGLNGSAFDPMFIDPDMNKLTVSGYTTNPLNSYTDIAFNCHISGQSSAYFQDGDIYFSGWIDASTSNPSGFLDNNLFIKVFQDRSILLNGNFIKTYPSGFCYPGNDYSYIYNRILLARGKIAANTVSLHSGLREYIVPLKEQIYYYDQYFNIQSGIADLTGSQIQFYDKRAVAHPNWDGADISLYYIGKNDTNASGYIDNLNIYTAQILNDNWGTPPTGVSCIGTLYTCGTGTTYSGVDLFLQQSQETDSLDLYLFNGVVNQYSGASPVNLTVYNGPTIKNNFLNLYIEGPRPYSGGLNLFITGPKPYSGFMPLYLHSPPPPAKSGQLTFYMNSSTTTSVIDAITLSMISGNQNIYQYIPLYLKTDTNDRNYGNIPLYIFNDATANKMLNLTLSQNASSIFNSQNLMVGGYGMFEGSLVKTGQIPLYMGTGNESVYNSVALSIRVPESNPGTVDLSIIGGTYIGNNVNLSIPSSVGSFNGGITTYTHGF